MPKTAFTENRTEAARAFVEHLRRHPAEARQDPAALAARFGLETEFVRRSLARLPAPGRAEEARLGPSRLAERAGGLVAFLDDALERASQNPVRFEAITLVLAIAATTLLGWVVPGWNRQIVVSAISVVVMLGTVAAQMAVFYRRRMARYALYGGLVFGVGTALPIMVSVWVALQKNPPKGEFNQGFIVLVAGLMMLLVGVLYAGLAALSSLAGGWIHLKRADEEWERLSRQELLERYFELQRRLERSVETPDAPEPWEMWPTVVAVRRSPFMAAAALGLAGGVTNLALRLAFGVGADAASASGAYELLSIGFALVAHGLFLPIGFLSGRATRGALAAAAFVVGGFLTDLVPVGGFGPAYALSSEHILSLALETALSLFVGALAGVGATIQRRATREGRLQRNDGATLVAEMLEIQWRLEEDATSVTVLVVDAAKSTAMKVGADPLDVEYSFREYQMWIAERCAGFGGRIHSVAGDGAVVAFTDGTAAMAASKRLQTDIARFNAEVNRLPKPFRLRLGLHAGRVAGDLNDVQFTEVIDIAAHVEEIAPVGGIAATEAVVATLGEDGFIPLARVVDGQAVYIALTPTEG